MHQASRCTILRQNISFNCFNRWEFERFYCYILGKIYFIQTPTNANLNVKNDMKWGIIYISLSTSILCRETFNIIPMNTYEVNCRIHVEAPYLHDKHKN